MKGKKNKKIVFVCTGNTCRSPMAVCIFKKMLKEKKVAENFVVHSAGINAGNNLPMNDNAIKALKTLNIPVLQHSSMRVEENDILESNIVITMTTEQKEFLSNYKNVYSIKQLAKSEDILDPFGEDFECYLKVCQRLIKDLNKILNLLVEENDISC